MRNRFVEWLLWGVVALVMAGCGGTPASPEVVTVTVIVPAPTRPIPLMYGRDADIHDEHRMARASGVVRTCQNMGCDVIGEFAKGDLVFVTHIVFGMNEWNESNRWYIVRWLGMEGYVPMEYLEFELEPNGA